MEPNTLKLCFHESGLGGASQVKVVTGLDLPQHQKMTNHMEEVSSTITPPPQIKQYRTDHVSGFFRILMNMFASGVCWVDCEEAFFCFLGGGGDRVESRP